MSDFQPDYPANPLTPGQWLQKWKCDRRIWVPSDEGRSTCLDILDIVPALPEAGQCADFLVKSSQTKEFYVCFAGRNRVFTAFSKPTLVVPSYGLNQAWWLLPTGKSSRIQAR